MAGRVLGGRYTVQDKIGTGGMAIVYRGLDNVLGRAVAIKTMLPQYAADPSFAARFKQEAQAAAALQSPYIVSVYDWGKDGDTYYIIMEYLRGTDLKTGIRRHGALDCKKVAQIGSQIASALAVAHRHDIIHRDIKPQNIMVQPDGNIKVMDFGIARAKNSHLTADNSVLGTAHYVSPEQTQGKELGPTSDLYSLGIVMYEAATGRVPFEGDDAISVALKQVNEQPVPPSQVNPRVDAELERIILKCMQKDPAARFQTADDLKRTLNDYLAGRMAAVNDATSVVGAAATTPLDRASATSSMPRVASPLPPSGSRLNTQTATAEKAEQEAKKGRRKKAVGIIVAIVAILALAAGVWAYTQAQSAGIEVPNLSNMTQDAAESKITSSGFEVGTVKEQYSDTVDSGKVIDQDPNAGKTATRGSKVNIVVSKGKEPAASVTVPDLSGMSPSEADAALTKVGLKGKAGDSVNSDTVESGRVAAQNPAAGSTAKAGDTITYQLSKGTDSVQVPDLSGKSASEATKALEAVGLKANQGSSVSSNSVDKGYVAAQSPSAGSTAKPGDTVTFQLSSGSSSVSVPDVSGMSASKAKSTLQNAGFDVSEQDVSSSTVASGQVIYTSPEAGSSATKGKTVTIFVSTGSSSSSATTAATSPATD
ncbi:MAG: Stk1 family PASTA domain-containing Ser/Thr kinase [Atopobiaceae bacterium]|jgi:serine/threonine-protein kinase|nr:Stk1 family PASTA domain-containing Ser/Thr kinase [Atopobiaceae bacterium]